LFALLIALVCIETAQQVLVVGVFDVDDIILDFIGAGFGILAQKAAACFIKKRMRE
jgi:glycopeptide antibiotics resistance protein